MPPSGVDYASEFLNGYAPEYVIMAIAILKKLHPSVGFLKVMALK